MADPKVNIIVHYPEWGEINKGIDGMHGTPADSVEEAMEIAKEYYPEGRTFLEGQYQPATKGGVESGR